MAQNAIKASWNTSADTLEVDFAIVLSRVIESAKSDPAELRHIIYEAARIRLQREARSKDPPADPGEMRRLSSALETAISRVEAISSKQDQLQALKSLDRLIGSVDPIGPTATGSPHPVLIVDHPTPNHGRMRLLGLRAFANRVPSVVARARNGYRVGPAARALLVAMFALAIYAAFHIRHQFFPQQAEEEAVPLDPAAPASMPAKPAESILGLRDFPLPSFYGMYAVSNGELYELDALPLKVPDPRIFMSGLLTKPSHTVIPDGRVAFVAFRRDLAANAPDRASVRVVARIVRAMSFTAGRKAAVSAVDDSWAVRNISYSYRVGPLGDQPEMLLIRPESSDFSLASGRYAMVLKDLAYDFTVAGEITNSAHCLERTEAANGTFYSECHRP
jgi:hypothetical protein